MSAYGARGIEAGNRASGQAAALDDKVYAISGFKMSADFLRPPTRVPYDKQLGLI